MSHIQPALPEELATYQGLEGKWMVYSPNAFYGEWTDPVKAIERASMMYASVIFHPTSMTPMEAVKWWLGLHKLYGAR